MSDFVVPFLVISLLIIFLILVLGRSPQRTMPRKKRRWWMDGDNSDYSILNPGITSPPEEPLSIFPREESQNSTPAPEYQILGIDSDTHPGTIDFGSATDNSSGFDSASGFDTSTVFDDASTGVDTSGGFDGGGFGGGGDFGGGGAGGDWGSSGSDGNS